MKLNVTVTLCSNSIAGLHSLALHLVEVAVTPLVTALVAAKALFLPFRHLLDFPSAVLTARCLSGEQHRRLFSDSFPAAERLHRVQGNPK